VTGQNLFPLGSVVIMKSRKRSFEF